MKNFVLKKSGLSVALLFSFFVFIHFNAAAQSQQNAQSPQYEPGVVLVQFKEGVNPQAVFEKTKTKINKLARVSAIKPTIVKFKKSVTSRKISLPLNINKANDEDIFKEAYKNMRPEEKSLYRAYRVELTGSTSVEQAAEALRANVNVEYAQPNYIISQPGMVPNDPQYSGQWNLHPDKLNCEPAWDIAQGEGVVVAVLDTGITYTHEDLAANMWINPGEIPGNGLDDDGNGYIDDVYGYDFTAMDNDPSDDWQVSHGSFGHGTSCAGVIAAVGNNQLGLIGIAPKAKIMAVRMLPSTTMNGVNAIKYAVDNGAKVLSCSWKWEYKTDILVNEAFDYAYFHGCVVVFAAMNDARNIDSDFLGPTKYMLISATDSSDQLASFSNYGSLISVAAPGVDIPTTFPQTRGTPAYLGFSGTSAAAPHVAGIAALLLSKNSNLGNDLTRKIIEVSADDLGVPGKDIYFGYGRVNALAALTNPEVTRQPSEVIINGKQLLLRKRLVDGSLDDPKPYIIKGINWQPATRAEEFFFDWPGRNPPGYVALNSWLKSQVLAHYQQDLALISQMNANTVRVYVDFDTDPAVYSQILNACWQKNIMVIMTVAYSKEDIDSAKYFSIVNLYKNHPAILMWSLGNEWNLSYNLYYGYASVAEAAQATQLAAERIKFIDPNHPVSSCLGDRFDDADSTNTIASILSICPAIDVWGINVYRGLSFGDLFSRWQSLTAKPLYISEFGTDSFRTTSFTGPNNTPAGLDGSQAANCQGGDDEQMQADMVLSLWRQIKMNLPAFNPQGSCLGGVVFEFNDELWKVGNYHVGLGGLVDYNNPPGNHSFNDYNDEGFVMRSQPDMVNNEEHFGVVDADRHPKAVFNLLEAYYPSLNLPPVLTPISDQNITEGQSLSFTVMATDPDGDHLTFSASNLPIGATFIDNGNNTAIFSWLSNYTRAGVYPISINAGDPEGLDSSQTVTITVTSDKIPPVTTISALPIGWSNHPVIVTLTAKDQGVGVGKTYYSTNGSNPSTVYTVPFVLRDGIYTIKYYSIDKVGNRETIHTTNQIKIDTTAPNQPVILLAKIIRLWLFDEFSAIWSSQDTLSGISEYQYRITVGSPLGVAIRNWTSTGKNSFVIIRNLRFLPNKVYYLAVKSKNGAGLWSNIGYSKGIKVIK